MEKEKRTDTTSKVVPAEKCYWKTDGELCRINDTQMILDNGSTITMDEEVFFIIKE